MSCCNKARPNYVKNTAPYRIHKDLGTVAWKGHMKICASSKTFLYITKKINQMWLTTPPINIETRDRERIYLENVMSPNSLNFAQTAWDWKGTKGRLKYSYQEKKTKTKQHADNVLYYSMISALGTVRWRDICKLNCDLSFVVLTQSIPFRQLRCHFLFHNL